MEQKTIIRILNIASVVLLSLGSYLIVTQKASIKTKAIICSLGLLLMFLTDVIFKKPNKEKNKVSYIFFCLRSILFVNAIFFFLVIVFLYF